MKKLIIGVIIGILVSTSFSVYADSMIGKAIKSTLPLFIEGKQASKDVIVVEGTSYLPVRAAGEMFGYDVSFDNENKSVILNKITTTVKKEEGTEGIIEEVQNSKEGENVIGDAYRKTGIVPVKSNTLDLFTGGNGGTGDTKPMQINGEWFVSHNLFRNYVNIRPYSDMPLIITLPGKKPIEIKTDTMINYYGKGNDEAYVPGMDYFKFWNQEWIKVSYIGLKAELKDGTLWIELIE